MSGVTASLQSLPPGGGLFELTALTIGIFLTDQPHHRFAAGTSRAAHKPLKKHEGWILPAGTAGVCEFDDQLDVLAVTIDTGLIQEAGSNAPQDFAPLVGAIDPVLLGLSLGAQSFSAGGTLYRETMHRAIAAQLVQITAPQRPGQPDIEDRRLRRVLDYIHDHLADDLTLATMADLAAMSPTHFSKAFKTATGASPLQYVIAARIDLAQILLKTTELTVAEIAYRTGYQDLSRFGQHFKRKTGLTPAKARG